jgi:hypothetical protein
MLLAGALGLRDLTWFGNYRGIALVSLGNLGSSRTALLTEVERRWRGEQQRCPAARSDPLRLAL